jgi:hypothetical protein
MRRERGLVPLQLHPWRRCRRGLACPFSRTFLMIDKRKPDLNRLLTNVEAIDA